MPKMILDTKLYTLPEVAELLGVTRSSVSKYISRGVLTATTIGARKFVTEENLRTFLQNTK